MTRLWDKGLPLDARILRFTAGEDHELDERLVIYDVRASIAHARMLEKQGLLSGADCAAICEGLGHLGVTLDPGRNAAHAETVSAADSACAVRVIETDEELVIARHCRAVLFPERAEATR